MRFAEDDFLLDTALIVGNPSETRVSESLVPTGGCRPKPAPSRPLTGILCKYNAYSGSHHITTKAISTLETQNNHFKHVGA